MKKRGLLEECEERRRCFEKDQVPTELKKGLGEWIKILLFSVYLLELKFKHSSFKMYVAFLPEFIGWLLNFTLGNLFPGACYQRQKSGMY